MTTFIGVFAILGRMFVPLTLNPLISLP